jgi:hypothetical protein
MSAVKQIRTRLSAANFSDSKSCIANYDPVECSAISRFNNLLLKIINNKL